MKDMVSLLTRVWSLSFISIRWTIHETNRLTAAPPSCIPALICFLLVPTSPRYEDVSPTLRATVMTCSVDFILNFETGAVRNEVVQRLANATEDVDDKVRQAACGAITRVAEQDLALTPEILINALFARRLDRKVSGT